MFSETCLICGATDWQPLPNPHPSQSVRSDGSITVQPLDKLQCMQCALVRKTNLDSGAQLAELYEEEYDMYSNRPQAERFDQARYSETAAEFQRIFGDTPPSRVLEVGCGNGSTLGPLQALWPESECIGIEPAPTAVASARAAGLAVYQGLVGGRIDKAVKGPFNFLYSMSVIEHTESPRAFVQTLISFLSPGGTIALVCPDGGEPFAELLLADHLYSFTRDHLCILVEDAGLEVLSQEASPGSPLGQLLIARKSHTVSSRASNPVYDRSIASAMFEKRKRYFEQWRQLEEYFQQSSRNKENIYLFGTGGLAAYLAANAPAFWQQVKGCTIDGQSDTLFHGKKIIDYRTLHSLKPDMVVIGTNPSIQQKLSERLKKDGYDTLVWNHLIAA